MSKSIFITGTDTAVGKTTVTLLLLKKLKQLDYKTFAMKPIASGCMMDKDNNLVNEDALALQAAASVFKPYSVVNPIALKEPIAPHLAARSMGKTLSINLVIKAIESCLATEADITIIEGIGGWSVPLNETELFSEVICHLKIPIILVVAIKLGCLNHAILTYHNILQMKAPLLGWVANCIEQETLARNENIETLKQWIEAPCLGVIPFRA